MPQAYSEDVRGTHDDLNAKPSQLMSAFHPKRTLSRAFPLSVVAGSP